MTSRPELKQAGAKRVAGLALRTDNATEARAGAGKIPGLWQRFRSEDWFTRLEKLGASGPPLGVYAAYESDASGSFQLLAGREVEPSGKLAAPLQEVTIPAGTYLVFHSGGELPESVVTGWQEIWKYFEQPGAPRRAYTVDFEVYPSAAEVEIWIALQRQRR